jgi:hypothetical protein
VAFGVTKSDDGKLVGVHKGERFYSSICPRLMFGRGNCLIISHILMGAPIRTLASEML